MAANMSGPLDSFANPCCINPYPTMSRRATGDHRAIGNRVNNLRRKSPNVFIRFSMIREHRERFVACCYRSDLEALSPSPTGGGDRNSLSARLGFLTLASLITSSLRPGRRRAGPAIPLLAIEPSLVLAENRRGRYLWQEPRCSWCCRPRSANVRDERHRLLK